jgi:hypothetical protein
VLISEKKKRRKKNRNDWRIATATNRGAQAPNNGHSALGQADFTMESLEAGTCFLLLKWEENCLCMVFESLDWFDPCSRRSHCGAIGQVNPVKSTALGDQKSWKDFSATFRQRPSGGKSPKPTVILTRSE